MPVDDPVTASATAFDYREYVVPTNVVSGWPLIREFLGEGSLLDVGCGDGGYLSMLGETSVGADLSIENLARARAAGLNVVEADLERPLPFEDDSFDGAFCSHVIEHVAAPLELLREVVRVVRPGGHVAVGVPTEGGMWRRLRGVDVFRDHPEHLYAFSPDGMRRLGEVAGLTNMLVLFDPPLVKRLGWHWAAAPYNRLPEWSRRQTSDSMWLCGSVASRSTAVSVGSDVFDVIP